VKKGGIMKNSTSKTMRVLFVMLLILIFQGCSKIEWPPETGYATEPKHRPSKAYEGKKATHVAEVKVSKDGEVNFMIPAGQIIEIRNGRTVVIFPGATIKYSEESPAKVHLHDYNGDECILPSGITVEVDEYGQFIPKKYEPKTS
jgi:hypothetical protein